MKSKKFRIPRKLKKKIPKNTHYCYTPISGMKKFKDGSYGYEIRPCPFGTHIKYKDMKPQPSWMDDEFLEKYGEEEDSWCKLVKCEILDRCKSCGQRYGKF